MACEIIKLYQLKASGQKLLTGVTTIVRSSAIYLTEDIAMSHAAEFLDKCTKSGFDDLDQNTVELGVVVLDLHGPEISEANVEGKNAG